MSFAQKGHAQYRAHALRSLLHSRECFLAFASIQWHRLVGRLDVRPRFCHMLLMLQTVMLGCVAGALQCTGCL
jgi:hypothetical protein